MTLASLHQVLTLRMSPLPTAPLRLTPCPLHAPPPPLRRAPALLSLRCRCSRALAAPLGWREGTQPRGVGGPAHPHARCLAHRACGTSAPRHRPTPRTRCAGPSADGRPAGLPGAGQRGGDLGQHGPELGLLSVSSRLSRRGKLRSHLPRHPLPSVLLSPLLRLSFPRGDGSPRRPLSLGEPRPARLSSAGLSLPAGTVVVC